ncbi:MAG: hypothetical protein KJZ60_04440 [Ignavibacteriaceae bacterium]|nr:hypothetical protein [Ignavibacteriaceae bacterium]
MQENIDPKFWEQKLKDEGLDIQRGEPEEVPIEAIEENTLLKHIDEETMKSFSLLSTKMQSNIIDYLKEQKSLGIDTRTALDKLKEVVEKSLLLEGMDSEDSDKNHKPENNSEVEPVIEELIEETVDGLIRRLEKIRHKEPNTESDNRWVN